MSFSAGMGSPFANALVAASAASFARGTQTQSSSDTKGNAATNRRREALKKNVQVRAENRKVGTMNGQGMSLNTSA